MSSLEKLLKAFENVRGSNTSSSDRNRGNGSDASVGTIQNTLVASTIEDSTKSGFDSPKTMASIASTLTQQSQNLLSKRDHSLTTRDKLSLCQSVSESVISGTKSGSDSQKLVSIGIETLMVLVDDQDPDVRMNADEALNRVIRSLSETHMGKIQLELFKEIKKNGSSRSLRGALTRFAVLCHHIRPQKCRAYVQNLLPHLNKIARRPEENLQETLTQSLEKILPVLGYFTNDNEIRSLLKAFLPNVTHSSASMRRSASACLMLLCQHSRKPHFFFLWVLDAILQMLIPIQEEAGNHLILGGLLVLRSLAPHFPSLSSLEKPSAQTFFDKGGGTKSTDTVLTFDQMIQVYEICLHYSSIKDHNIVTASLETLQALLQNSSPHLLMALAAPEGLTRSRIAGEKTKKLTSRAASQVSITPSLQEEESNIENLVEMCSKVEICDEEGMPHGDKATLLPQGDSFQEEDCAERQEGLPPTPDSPEFTLDEEVEERSGSVYSEIEIGPLSDTSLLLGRKDIEIGEPSHQDGKKRKQLLKDKSVEDVVKTEVSSDKTRILGNIGSFTDEDVPVKYLARYLCSSFLLTGCSGTLISDQTSKVSIKVLALNCLGLTLSLQPSLMAETLFIMGKIAESSNDEDVQRVDDALLFRCHHDPQIRASVGVLVGQFIHSSLVNNNGHHFDLGRPTLSLEALLDLLSKLLYHTSSVTVRGAIAGFNLCLQELFHSRHATSALPAANHLMNATSNTYWLIKVELCELFANLPHRFIDHLECEEGNVKVHIMKSSLCSNSTTFSHRIISSVFIPLLKDQDQRVRKAAAVAITRLVPHLMVEGDIVLGSSFTFVPSGQFTGGEISRRRPMGDPSCCVSPKGASFLVSPFDKLLEDCAVSSISKEKWKSNEKSVAKIVHVFSSNLLSCNEKYFRLGCLEALTELCETYPPVLHPRAWSCHVIPSQNTGLEKGKHFGLVTLLLSMSSEASIAGDLLGQQFILKISASWLAGRAVMILKENKGRESSDDKKKSWQFLGHPKLTHTAENLLQHILRILCVYMHVLEGTVPTMRNSLVQSGTAAALSPIKRKSRSDSGNEKTRSHSPGKAEKLEEDREKIPKSGSRRTFAHLPEYIKLYDVLKSAYQNYKMSLEEDVKQKFCSLLQETLTSLGTLLELASMSEFGRLAEELLQYLIVATPILPTHTIFCGQQLLKCLFGSNLMALWWQIFPSLDPPPPPPLPPLSSLSPISPPTDASQVKLNLHTIAFSYQSSQLHRDLQALTDGTAEPDSLSLERMRRSSSSNSLRLQSKGTDKVSLSSYIRLFEPLVIKALKMLSLEDAVSWRRQDSKEKIKLYTVSSDVVMQRSVLELLINLVQIRVNYCLLDSEQIFIGYVIKQFEYIEEGQIKHADELIPSMFNFLVLLSYERHHSKSIIGVPKIIQLCDGLMASGQPPLSHCVLALRPLVEDLFLERTHSSVIDQKELETQREVICSMLLRLAHYYQVLQLLSIVLVSTRENNKDRWRKLSRQILDVILPRISKLQINIDSKVALFALEEVLSSVCASVFRPPDALLKALLTSPCEIESTEGVERWVGGVHLLLRILVTRIPLDMVLERLDLLGLSMDYVRPDGDILNTSLYQSLSPKRFGSRKNSPSDSSSPPFIDPLNVTQPSIKPEVAIARFILEVLRVSVGELKTLEFTKLQGPNVLENNSDFLFHLTLQLLLILVHLKETGQWEPIMTSFKTIVRKETEIVDELSESFMFCARWHPALALRWCQLLSQIDYAPPSLWSNILRTCPKKIGTPSHESSETRGKSTSSCLSLEFMRRAGFLLFADFVLRHSQEGEWLTWLVVQHIRDIVVLHAETPVRALLQGIYSSSAASALLIQAFHARCNCVDKAQYGNSIISIVSGVHPAQSGPVLVFLVDRMIASPFLVVSRSAAALCAQKLHYMLANPSETHLSTNDAKKLILTMKKNSLSKRYGQVYSLLHQLLIQQQKDSSITSPPEGPSPVTPASRTSLDLNWYLQLVKNRCCAGEGGGHECGELLSHLDYNDVLMVMSSKHFNLALLPHAFRLSLNMALQANSSWVDSSSVDTGDSEGSSINEACEPPLLSACKGVLLQQVNMIVSEIPKSRLVFIPDRTGGGKEYSDELCKKVFDDVAFRKNIEILSPSVIEFLSCATSLSWKAEMHSEAFENILSFAILNLELLHWYIWHSVSSVSTSSKCLACVDVALQHSEIIHHLDLPKNANAVFSMVFALHSFATHSCKPDSLPSLPSPLESSLKGNDSTCLAACKKLMELILWFEAKKDRELPSVLSHPFRGIMIALARTSCLNSVVRTPPELWTLGWFPEISESQPLSLPPFPVDLLQETEVLKQFIFRIGLLGFVGRQQFEETWMQLLSVLSSTPNADTPLEEVPYINLSLSLAVRGITSLLVQTLLMPQPGNPHNSPLLHLSRDKLPSYFTTKGGQRLQKVMHQLHLKLKEVQHIMRGGPKVSPKYHAGQLSVESLSSALLLSNPPTSTVEVTGTYYEIETRQKLLTSCGLDVQSCLHFLHYLYSSWLSPQSGLCSSVIAEVVKSVSVLCDLFTSSSHHKWILETLVPLHSTHPVEDHITSQYIIIATCEALATLKAAKQEVSSSLTEGVLHIVEAGLRSIQVSVRACALQGILYLLQAPQQESSSLINIATNYILKCNDGKSTECESHEVAVWEVCVYLVERFPSPPDPTLPPTALHMALTAAASPSTSPRILHQVLRGVERLILVQESSSGTVEVVLKLAMDLVLHSAPAVSLAALPLFLTALHCSTRAHGAHQCPPGELSRPEDLASDPELLLQFMEKLSVLFDRIRVCLPYEAGVLAGLLGTCLLDILPASQLLNKVITEYISSHQPHPHLLAATLFQVFEAAMNEGGENLVQEWVLLSLSNFTQRTPVALAVWCLTCFFIAASNNRWLRAAFPSVQARLGRLEDSDVQIFCLAGAHFRSSLATQQQRNKFDDVFHSASSPGSPFEELLNCIKHSSEGRKSQS